MDAIGQVHHCIIYSCAYSKIILDHLRYCTCMLNKNGTAQNFNVLYILPIIVCSVLLITKAIIHPLATFSHLHTNISYDETKCILGIKSLLSTI